MQSFPQRWSRVEVYGSDKYSTWVNVVRYIPPLRWDSRRIHLKRCVTDLSQSLIHLTEKRLCVLQNWFPPLKVSSVGFPPCSTVNSSPTVKTVWDQPISRVEYIRIELHNLVFFHYLLYGFCNRASLSALQKKKVAKKEKLGLTYNTVSLSASHPPAKSAVSAAPHNTRLCWFHMRGALFGSCPTWRGSASAEYSGGKCELSY